MAINYITVTFSHLNVYLIFAIRCNIYAVRKHICTGVVTPDTIII